MPLIDFETSPSEVSGIPPTDALVIGAGAAGIFLASILSDRGLRVTLIESGHKEERDDRQSLNQIEETGKKQANSIWNRKRALGGTTIAWGGQSLPFCPIDFEKRSWVSGAGWPIRHHDLSEHYDRANRFMGVDNRDYREETAEWVNRPDPGLDPKQIDYHFSKWAPQPNFFKRHRRVLGQKITVISNAHALGFSRGTGNRITAVKVANFSGHQTLIQAKHVMIAAGGIESNRLLWLAERDHPGRSGNHSDWLGRGFMDHPTFSAGRMHATDLYRLQRNFGTQLRHRWKYSVRLSAAESWQRDQKLLNISAGFLFGYPEDQSDWFENLKSTVRRPHPSQLKKMWSDRAHVREGLWAFAQDRFIYRPKANASLWLMCEQIADRESRITLSKEVDQFGLPRARLHWQVSPETWHTMKKFSCTLRDELNRLGYGNIQLDSALTDPTDNFPTAVERLGDVNHHMGGTRMSSTPDTGVVDPNLKVWGIPNLHICSASVFPTSSHSNPTLTLLALCSRLGAKTRIR